MPRQKKSDVGFKNELKNTDYEKYLDLIKEKINGVMSNYVMIGHYLNQLSKEDLFKQGNYDSIFQLGVSEFNLSETTIKNSMGVASKYCDEDGNIKDEFKNYTFSALVELLPVESEKILIDFVPEMTVKEIREVKKSSKSKPMKVLDEEIEDDVDSESDDSTEEPESISQVSSTHLNLSSENITKLHPYIYHFLSLFLYDHQSSLFVKIVNKIKVSIYLDYVESDENLEFMSVEYLDNELIIKCSDEEINTEIKSYLQQFSMMNKLLKTCLDIS